MHRRVARSGVLSLVLLLMSCGSALETLNAVTPTTGYTKNADLIYGAADRQKLDIYRSGKRIPDSPTIVFVYGGAWREGRRQDYEFVAGDFAKAGYDVIVPDYRLFPDVTWPTFVTDVAQAIARVRDAEEVLLERPLGEIVLIGHSSGAHTVSVLAANPARWWPRDVPAIAGMVGISGPYDLPLEDPEVAPVFAGLDDPATVKLPLLRSAGHPATLLLYGEDDERVKPLHSERYARILRAAGTRVELDRLQDTGHAASIAGFAAPLHFLNDASELTLTWLEANARRETAHDD